MPDSIERRYLPPSTDHEGIQYEGEVDNQGRRDGRGIALYPDGTLHEGYFVEGKCQGRGRSIYVTLSVYTGEFYNDLRHGYGSWDSIDATQGQIGWSTEGYFFKNSDFGWTKIKHVDGYGY